MCVCVCVCVYVCVRARMCVFVCVLPHTKNKYYILQVTITKV